MSGVGKITKNNDLSKIKMIIRVCLAYPPMLRKIRLCPQLQEIMNHREHKGHREKHGGSKRLLGTWYRQVTTWPIPSVISIILLFFVFLCDLGVLYV